MATLTINFQDMFLLVRHQKGGVVLLPSTGHRAELTAAGTTLVLDGHQINIAHADGTTIWGEPPAFPDPDAFLIDMADAFGCPTRLRSGYISSTPVPAQCHARVVLAGSTAAFIATPTRRYPGARDVVWTVTRANSTTHAQKLTDFMKFEMPLTSDLLLLVSKLDGRPAWRIPIPAGADYMVTITNGDDPPGPPPAPNPDSRLVEYDILYGLMKSNCAAPSAPVGNYPGETDPVQASARPVVGVGVVARVRGDGDPICGGGQGDPPEPPEDPPPPDPGP
jgi:hypothetical protein